MEELQCRKLLLDSYSSQLTTHARLIIGFAIILLTLLEVKRNLQPSISHIQFGIVYFGIFIAAFGLWFLLMRHLMYGLLVTAATLADPLGEGSSLMRILNGINEFMLNKRFLIVFPSRLFHSTGRRRSWLDRLGGVLLCAILALVTTIFALILMG